MRGGGGGGYHGGGGGGGYSRTPSMSRPASRPSSVSRPSGPSYANTRPSHGNLPTPGSRPASAARPSTGARPATGARPGTPAGGKPSRGDVNNFLGLPGTSGGARPATQPSRGAAAAAAGGALAGGAAAEFLQNRPSQLPSGGGDRVDVGQPGRPDVGQPGRPDVGQPGRPDIGQPGRPDIGQPGRPDVGRPGTPGQNRPQNLPDRIANREQWQDWRQQHGDNIRDYWNDNDHLFDDWFDGNWWNNGLIDSPYVPNFAFWAWASWGGIGNWVDDGWSDPVYYNYGENVYYDDGSVYYGDQAVCSEEEYAAQAEAIAMSEPEAPPAEDDWMPLGVFAVTSDGQPSGAEPTMYLQLAVSRQGVISGTFQNTATDSVQAVEGMVDKQTQRTAWTAAGKSRPLMETGIGNLTEDTAPVLVHFADGSTQQWLLVRLEKPSDASATPDAPGTAAPPKAQTPPATPPPTTPNP
jgi:hypothetical protein